MWLYRRSRVVRVVLVDLASAVAILLDPSTPILLFGRLRRVRVVFVASAVTIFPAPSSPMLLQYRSSLVRVLFVASAVAILPARSSPTLVEDRLSSVRSGGMHSSKRSEDADIFDCCWSSSSFSLSILEQVFHL